MHWKGLKNLTTVALIAIPLLSFSMTPKYPYDPVTTTCGVEVTIVGEAFKDIEQNTNHLRLQADLNIIESSGQISCPAQDAIKVVKLLIDSPDHLVLFKDNLGQNISATGTATITKDAEVPLVIFTASKLEAIKEEK